MRVAISHDKNRKKKYSSNIIHVLRPTDFFTKVWLKVSQNESTMYDITSLVY